MIRSAQLGSPEIPSEINAACMEVAEKELNLLRNLDFGHTAWIAGGTLRAKVAKQLGYDEGETDVDCYFSGRGVVTAYNRIVSKRSLNAEVVVENDDLLSLSTSVGKIDLIRNYQGRNAGECLLKFDFTCCAIAIDTNNMVYWHDDAVAAIRERKLRVLNVTNGFSSLLRTQKYVRKGYSIDLEENEKLARVIVSQGTRGINYKVDNLRERGSFYREYESPWEL